MPEPTYREGDWFAVPLHGGGFAAVIIARAMPRKEGVLLGYSFGPRRAGVPALGELGALSTSDAVRWRSAVPTQVRALREHSPGFGRANWERNPGEHSLTGS